MKFLFDGLAILAQNTAEAKREEALWHCFAEGNASQANRAGVAWLCSACLAPRRQCAMPRRSRGAKPAHSNRVHSSMVEHLSYKQRVIGSNPFVLKNTQNRQNRRGEAQALPRALAQNRMRLLLLGFAFCSAPESCSTEQIRRALGSAFAQQKRFALPSASRFCARPAAGA